MANWFTKTVGAIFGSSSNGKSVAETAVETYERFNPSKVKQHEMAVDDIKAGDQSQLQAQQMQLKSHDSWFDIFIDGWNRAQRPAYSTYAFLVLTNNVDTIHFNNIHPMAWNIIWTIIGFWFGTRMIFKDIPAAFAAYKNWRNK